MQSKTWGQAEREMLRGAYLERINELAERLRPWFQAGEFRGFNDADGRKLEGLLPPKIGRVFASIPPSRLEAAVERALGLREDANAAAVIAASPSAAGAPKDSLLYWAVECATWDVLRIARRRSWCRVTRGETPTNAQLGLRRVA